MHLLTALVLRKPGPLFKFAVVGTQGELVSVPDPPCTHKKNLKKRKESDVFFCECREGLGPRLRVSLPVALVG